MKEKIKAILGKCKNTFVKVTKKTAHKGKNSALRLNDAWKARTRKQKISLGALPIIIIMIVLIYSVSMHHGHSKNLKAMQMKNQAQQQQNLIILESKLHEMSEQNRNSGTVTQQQVEGLRKEISILEDKWTSRHEKLAFHQLKYTVKASQKKTNQELARLLSQVKKISKHMNPIRWVSSSVLPFQATEIDWFSGQLMVSLTSGDVPFSSPFALSQWVNPEVQNAKNRWQIVSLSYSPQQVIFCNAQSKPKVCTKVNL